MAFITLAGKIRDPNSDLSIGDQIRFTQQSTTGETLPGAVSVITISVLGTYSVNLQYGLVLVEYRSAKNPNFRSLGIKTVNSNNPATSIPELLTATVPVSSADLIAFQTILADAVTAKNAAVTAETGAVTARDVAVAASIIQYQTFAELLAISETVDYKQFTVAERANAAYTLQPSGYAALAGDATLANGRIAKLQINADINIANFANLEESLQRDYKLGSTYTINIPTDAATLQDAVLMSGSIEGFNEYSNIILNIESGHAPASGIILNGQDLSKFTVTSTDAVVTVSSSWSATSSFILALNSIAPTLGCVVNMNLKGEKGYHLDEASKGRVLASCGVNNAGGLTSGEGTGLFLSGASQCSAKSSVFNGSYRNIWAAHESICYADFANADGATGDAGVYCARGSHVGISYGSASNCAGNGVRCRRAFLLCMQVTATGNGTGGAGYGVLVTEGGTVIASQGDGSTIDGADLSNNKQGAINCDASTVIARESDLRAGALTGSANSVIATSGSTVNVELSDLRGLVGTNYVSGILARQSTVIAMTAKFDYNTSSAISSFSSTIDCASATINRSQRGINAQKVSRINASNVAITNSTVHGVLSQGGSIVSVDDGSVTASATTDLRIEEGGQIVGHNCATTAGGTPTVANTNVSALNAIYSTGIIWG